MRNTSNSLAAVVAMMALSRGFAGTTFDEGTLVKRLTRQQPRPFPKMVTSPPEEIEAWNRQVEQFAADRRAAKYSRQRAFREALQGAARA